MRLSSPRHRFAPFVAAALLVALSVGRIPAEENAKPGGPPPSENSKSGEPVDTLWVIPHTHWEGAVFKTREEYLHEGMGHIIHALALLEKYPEFTFVLDQAAYVKPFLDRFPEQEAKFKKYVQEGRLEIVLGMDVMPDVNKPSGESVVRQIQYGKGYFRQKLGADVKVAWLVDTFGHNAQMPQILKLGGYRSFWFFRGVPNDKHPANFLWEGIDGTRIPSLWMHHGYGIFYGSPKEPVAFEHFAKECFGALGPSAQGVHHRAAPAGADVTDAEDQLPPMMRAMQDRNLGFKIRFGTPSQYDEAVALGSRENSPVFKGELNPIFQGTYSSRIELKQLNREMEQRLGDIEKLEVIAEWLGQQIDRSELWQAWEPVLFSQTHDLGSGVMTDHVYEDEMRDLGGAAHIANELLDSYSNRLVEVADTSGEGMPIVVFNSLGWERSDVAEITLSFAESGVKGVTIVDSTGAECPTQIMSASRDPSGAIRDARVAFVARGVPSLGYAVFHVRGRASAEPAQEAHHAGGVEIENEHLKVKFDVGGGAIASVRVKDGDWEALAGPANVVARSDDHGDLWEIGHPLDGASRYAMTNKQSIPRADATTRLSSEEQNQSVWVTVGPVYSEFAMSRPFDGGEIGTTVRLATGSRRLEITTRLVNQKRQVRYQALFPTSIKNGKDFQSIAFGAIERPNAVEYPAQDWIDYGDDQHGVALLNVGLPGNVVTDGTMMLSLLRSQALGAYDGSKLDPSDSGFEIGKERTLRYALAPHAGDWRAARVYRQGMELGHPLVCRKASTHAGKLPARWGLLDVSAPNVVVSAIQAGKDGAALVRVYEATGAKADGVKLTLATDIEAAGEVNLLEDPLAPLKPEGRTVAINLKPYEIKTISVRLAKAK